MGALIKHDAPPLAVYDEACRALARAVSVDETKKIRDVAAALAACAKIAKNTQLASDATKLRLRAERRMGELLRKLEKPSGGQVAGKTKKIDGSRKKPSNRPATLKELGINKTQSSRYQTLAKLDEKAFEEKLTSASKRAYDGIARRFIKEDKVKQAKARHAKRIEHGCRVDDLVALAATGYRAGVIDADPAWVFKNWSPDGGLLTAAANEYNESALDEIMRLPVGALAADNCALFLWCTWPHIAIGSHHRVMEAWGFKPSTCAFNWIKTKGGYVGDECPTTTADTQIGNGYWTRSNSEVCLIGIKGSPLKLDASVRQEVFAPRGEHSEKPEEVRLRIERLFPGPYLELYGRKKDVPGWTVWGNEIPREEFGAPIQQTADIVLGRFKTKADALRFCQQHRSAAA